MDIDFASSCNHYRMYCWLSFFTRITVASEDFQTTTLRPCRISFTRRSRSGRSAFTFWTKMLQMLRPGLTRSGSCPCRWNREFGICWLSKKAPASAIPTAFSARTLTLQFPTAAMLIRVPESGFHTYIADHGGQVGFSLFHHIDPGVHAGDIFLDKRFDLFRG